MTPNAWMRMYMQILHGPRTPNCQAFSLPAYSGLPFSRAMQVAQASLYLRSNNLGIKSESLDKNCQSVLSLGELVKKFQILIQSEGSVYGYEYRIAEPVGSRTSFFPNPLKFVTELGSVLY
jgi:hypothetical protein